MTTSSAGQGGWTLNATIDGGAGNDTFDVRDMGIADLSQTTLTTSRQFILVIRPLS